MRLANALAAALLTLATWPSAAASLKVAPISLSLAAPSSAATITLRNEADRPIHIQVRPFAWRQHDGKDILEPTRDLVASPPISMVAPGIDYVVRVVRLTKRPVIGEESYRLLIDELPDPGRRSNGTVSVLLRYSVPVFVSSPDAGNDEVAWRIDQTRRGTVLTAINSGERHLRISNMRIRPSQGATILITDGLAGYVLGGAAKQWVLPFKATEFIGKDVRLIADSEAGAFDATVAVGTAR